MSAITQSMLGSADTCLRRFQYDLQRPTWYRQVGGVDRAIGTGVHAGLAWYYGQRIDNPSLLPDAEGMIQEAVKVFDESTRTDLYNGNPIEVFHWSDDTPDFRAAEKTIGDLIHAYVTNEWWLGLEHQILAVELNEHFEDETSGRTFKLGADLVSTLGNRIRLTDHKTSGKAWSQGKESPRRQNQSPLYTWAARKKWPEAVDVEFAFDIVIHAGKRTPVRFERRITSPTPAHEQAVVSKALNLMSLYELAERDGIDLPTNPSSTLCNPKWCDYWDGCPHGAALDETRTISIGSSLTPFTVNEPAPTPPPPKPDEGADATEEQVAPLREPYKAHKAWMDSLREEAISAGVDWHLSPTVRTLRRVRIVEGLLTLAAADANDDDVVKALVRHVTGSDAMQWPTLATGAVVGTLNVTEAAAFVEACKAFVAGRYQLVMGDVPELREVA